MNRSVICGAAGLAMLVAVALATTENTANAGHFNRCGGGGLFSGGGGGGLFHHARANRGCDGGRQGLFQGRRGGGGLFGHHRARRSAGCCAPVYCEPVVETCCEPVVQPQPCCGAAPVVQSVQSDCCGAAPVVQSGCCGGAVVGGQVIHSDGGQVIYSDGGSYDGQVISGADQGASASDSAPPQPQPEANSDVPAAPQAESAPPAPEA